MLENETDFFNQLTLGFGVLLFCQFIYTLRAGRVLKGKAFHQLGTLDNSWAFEESEEQEVVKNSTFDIFLAAMGGLAWTYMLFVMAMSFRFITQLSFKDESSTFFSLVVIFSIVGSFPSVIFNIRTWNMSRLR